MVASKHSIAVLPFINMSSSGDEEYFSDGITEEIINSLANIDGLHVTSRTSSFAFKNMNIDVREIGKQLNVSLILEGSIRKSDDDVRITAQLIRTDDGFHVWSSKWDRKLNSIFILQDEIAGIIAGKINSNIKQEVHSREKKVENTEALDYYLRGNFLHNKWDYSLSVEMVSCFEKAIELDPSFSKPYISLCNALAWMASTGQVDPVIANKKIDQYLVTATGLDKNMADIYSILASRNYWMEWNIPEALSNVNKALQLRPSFMEVILHKGMILASMGQIEECFDHLFQAERLNPFHTTVNFCIALIYRLTGEPEKALEYVGKNIRIVPEWRAQYTLKVELLCMVNRFDEAWQLIVQNEGDPRPGLSISELKAVYHAFKGDREGALSFANRLLEEINSDLAGMSYNYGYLILVYLLLGDYEKTLELLELGVKYRSAPLLFMMIDPLWDNLRDHPIFISNTRFLSNIEFDLAAREIKKYRKTSLTKDVAEKLKSELERVMVKEKPYLDPKLNLSDIAEMINCSPNQLSQLLNENIGRNFYDYVNEFRLGHFNELAKNPRNKQFTFLSLAYESGFNSKSTFNSFFKKITGVTPSEYLK